MQMQAQDLEIVPVKFTDRSIGKSTLGVDEDIEENGSVLEQADRHSDDEAYDHDSPAGYRDALTRD